MSCLKVAKSFKALFIFQEEVDGGLCLNVLGGLQDQGSTDVEIKLIEEVTEQVKQINLHLV